MPCLLLWLLLINVAAKPTSQRSTSKPGCPESCGSVNIPYPFGMSPGCYYDHLFRITCNQTFNPPKPFFPGTTNNTILNISLEDGELRIETFISRECYNKLGDVITNDSFARSYTIINSKFPVSYTRNKFTAVGCSTQGLIATNFPWAYAAGCVSFCSSYKDIANGSCSGLGCCQIDIPQGIFGYSTIVQSVNIRIGNSSSDSVHSFNPCAYAFVVEDQSYNFSSIDVKEFQNKTVPVVLDWAVGDLTCEEAKKNSTPYACKANESFCLNSTNGRGYRCKCSEGFEGNPYLLDGCQDIDECERSNPCNMTCDNLIGSFRCSCVKGFEGDGKRGGTGCSPIHRDHSLSIALGICIAFLALLVGGSWIYWGEKKRRLIKHREKFFQKNGGLLLQQQLLSHHRGSQEASKIFTSDELNKATNDFDQSRVIGQGGYGTVYQGVLTDNKVVAIKKSKISDQSQIEQFINEVIVLSQINHRNVVKLLGCCLETEVPLLVYEFITNGTLADHIHDKLGKYCSLSWEMRLKIATETAGAVAYLHSSTSMPIIHRDIKTANILLDDYYVAKVSDFGASRLIPLDQTQLTTLVQGTLGYLDPEYFHTSQLTEKSDVYSFGVVLAELLTAQKALSFTRPESGRNLALYFVSSLKDDRLVEILDENLASPENLEQVKVVANLAQRCLRVRGEERPSMKVVASELEGLRHNNEMHPWEKDDGFNEKETEYLLQSSDVYVGKKEHGGCSSITAERFQSMNMEMLQSYRDGR
ncbi:hypothetical protein UlMin_017919 [Ulmus minor]